jgi:hypothetical protein
MGPGGEGCFQSPLPPAGGGQVGGPERLRGKNNYYLTLLKKKRYTNSPIIIYNTIQLFVITYRLDCWKVGEEQFDIQES